MQNKLTDLNNYLFEELENLMNSELTQEKIKELEEEIVQIYVDGKVLKRTVMPPDIITIVDKINEIIRYINNTE